MKLISALLLLAGNLPAQLPGQLSGTVGDPTGAAIPGAQVSLFLPDGKTPLLTTKTSSDGIFDFTGVRPDLYQLTVEFQGFSKYSVSDVKVDPARRLTLPAIVMAVSSSAQTVE